MFKWACLAVATVFLAGTGWMINDIRLRVLQTTETVQTAGQTINTNLPAIVDKSRQTTDVVSKNLPEVVERVNRTTEVVAELAEDIRQLKELAGVANTARDKNLVAYADSLLSLVESSKGSIGTHKVVGTGLKSPRPAAEWVAGARKEALVLTVLVKSKKEMLTRLAKTKLGQNWYIQLPGKDPVPLLDWLKENHAESREL